MWDFVGRTLAMLYGLPPSLPGIPAPPPTGVNVPGGPEAWMAKQKSAWYEGMLSLQFVGCGASRGSLIRRANASDSDGPCDLCTRIDFG